MARIGGGGGHAWSGISGHRRSLPTVGLARKPSQVAAAVVVVVDIVDAVAAWKGLRSAVCGVARGVGGSQLPHRWTIAKFV